VARGLGGGGLVLLLGLASLAAAGEADRPDLTSISIEQLAAIKVTTVSRRPETRLQAAGAVHVITPEDMRRTGALALPDALRLAPGVQASMIDADEWALAVRGFASRLSRSVQVLMDGRSLWTPLFAGVFWDAQDAMVEDLDRVEVSRGPGGALYGANALNGVINIVSKDAAATPGGLLTLGGGDADRVGALRWGGRLDAESAYRVWGKYLRRDGTVATGPAAAYDDAWSMASGGLRVDTHPGPRDTVTFNGQVGEGRSRTAAVVAQFVAPFSSAVEGPVRQRQGSALGEWRHGFAGGGETLVRSYYEHTTRREPQYNWTRDSADLEGQHRFQWGRQETMWGASYRFSRGTFLGTSPALQLAPPKRNDDIAGLFLHNESRLAGGNVRLVAGAKLEWNTFAGWNLQPGARLGWSVTARDTLWAAVNRAVRTTSRVERDIRFFNSLDPDTPLFALVQGSPDFEPESVITYEVGYKTRMRTAFYVDLAGFYSSYDDLASNEVGTPFVQAATASEPPRVVIPVKVGNGQEGSAAGVEATGTCQVGRRLRVQASYSFLRVNQTTKPGSTDRNEGFEGNSPRHQLWTTAFVNMPGGLDLGLVFRRVGRIASHDVPAFSELDARLAARLGDSLELSVAGRNLLHDRHPEFGGGFAVERSVMARATFEW
jgi:iron complex outermembrane recepter protein